MSSFPVKKERWTLTIDRRVKHSIIDEARRRRVRPARLLEDLIKEKLNPFGHTEVVNPTAYVRTLRRKSRKATDKEFLADLKRWEKVRLVNGYDLFIRARALTHD